MPGPAGSNRNGGVPDRHRIDLPGGEPHVSHNASPREWSEPHISSLAMAVNDADEPSLGTKVTAILAVAIIGVPVLAALLGAVAWAALWLWTNLPGF